MACLGRATRRLYSLPKIVPKLVDLELAANVLNAGKKVAILIGAGARGAADEVLQVAELLGAGVAKALLERMSCLTIFPSSQVR